MNPNWRSGSLKNSRKKPTIMPCRKELLAEIRMLTDQMKRLLKNFEEHPDKYFRFSLF